MIDKNSIPNHWVIKKLGEVANYLNGRAFKPNEWETKGVPIIRIQNLNNPELSFNYSTKEFEDRYKIESGDLLFAWSASLGVFFWTGEKAWLNQHIFKVVPKECCDKKYLFFFLDKIISELYEKAHGSGMVHVTKGIFESTRIPLPPNFVQKQIVTKIEELFGKLDNGKKQLEIVQQQLKTYRQAVLKWAFEGKLTYKEVINGQLPEGWEWKTFENVCYKIGDIDHKMPKNVPTGYPYVSTKDFTDDLRISFEKVKYINKHDYLTLSRKIRPEKEDIIFPRYGTIGKNIFVDFEKEFLVSYSCAVIKPNKNIIIPKFIYYYSLSPQIEDEIRNYIVETTQANIGIASIKRFILPLPPLSEQKKIVQEIETRLSVCDKMEESVETALKQIESLRQSILKQAFEGKLISSENK